RRRLVRVGEPAVQLLRPFRAYLGEGQPLPLAEVALDEVVVDEHRRFADRLRDDVRGAGAAGQRRGDDPGDVGAGQAQGDRARLRGTPVTQRHVAPAGVPPARGQLRFAVA